MRQGWIIGAVFALGMAWTGCATDPARKVENTAKAYTKLALALGEVDDGYVGFYFGPDEWLAGATVAGATLPEIREDAQELHEGLVALDPPADEMERLRFLALDQLLTSMIARIEILEGHNPVSFDDETRRLYQVVLPRREEAYFRQLFNELDAVLPGDGPLVNRLGQLQELPLGVPAEYLPAVAEAAVAECRRRTLEHIELPENENLAFEYLTGVPFGGRSVYLGNGRSVLQLNTEVPMTFSAVVNLACHEGYPGHHVQNVLRDKHLAQDLDWVEYTVSPLYSPGALVAEGAATYGAGLIFPGDELRQFTADVLLPLTGIDPAELGEPSTVPLDVREKARELLKLLKGVGEEVARRYLDGEFDRDTAAQWLAVFGLMGTIEAGGGFLQSIEESRTHLINYGYGEQWVRAVVERGKPENDRARLIAMADLFTRPFVAKEL